MCWCWKENDICAASFATMMLFGNLKEFETSTLIIGDAPSVKNHADSGRVDDCCNAVVAKFGCSPGSYLQGFKIRGPGNYLAQPMRMWSRRPNGA